jgi:hypothetical protein
LAMVSWLAWSILVNSVFANQNNFVPLFLHKTPVVLLSDSFFTKSTLWPMLLFIPRNDTCITVPIGSATWTSGFCGVVGRLVVGAAIAAVELIRATV